MVFGFTSKKKLKEIKRTYEEALKEKERIIEGLKEKNRRLMKAALEQGMEQKEIIDRLKKGLEEK